MASRKRLNKVSFFLARPKSKTPTAVLVRMRMGTEEVRFGSGISVLPKEWLSKSQRIKSSVLGATVINARLDRITEDLTGIVYDLRNHHIEPTPELVRSRYEALTINDASRSKEKNFFDFWEEWLDQTGSGKTESTIRQNRSVMNKLKEYQEDRGAVLTFDRIDREFFESFTRYLITVKNLTNPTVWNQIKRIKAFMTWGVKRGLTTNRYSEQVTMKDFNVQPPPVVRLTREEFDRFTEFDLSASPHLRNARDLFILQACLGVRVSDLLKIVKNPTAFVFDQNGTRMIRIVAQKTRKEQVIPLNARANRILFGANPPHPISDVKYNLYLKEAAKVAGLDRTIVRSEFRGVQRTDIQNPLFDEISSHSAKRTFVSLMVASHVNIQVITDITGNTLQSIKRYIKLDEEEIALEAKKADAVFS